MSRFDDFFDEKPPKNHAENILHSVSAELERNQKNSVSGRSSRRTALWGFFTLAASAAAAVMMWNRQALKEKEDLKFAAFSEVESEDLDLLSDGDDEDLIGLLESLDEDETWEES